MSCQPLPNLVTFGFDGFEFARREERLSGRLELADLPRLADVVLDPQGTLACALTGRQEIDTAGRQLSYLTVAVAGRLLLRCQRCLEPMAFDCAIERQLLLIRPGDPWPEDELEQDAYDAIEVAGELSLRDLVEEEILLALPIVPRHDDCRLPSGWRASDEPSPFAALAGLLNKH